MTNNSKAVLKKELLSILTNGITISNFQIETINKIMAAIDSYVKEAVIKELEMVKLMTRGEGEPGNAGEMISNNYVDELINSRLAALTTGDTP